MYGNVDPVNNIENVIFLIKISCAIPLRNSYLLKKKKKKHREKAIF